MIISAVMKRLRRARQTKAIKKSRATQERNINTVNNMIYRFSNQPLAQTPDQIRMQLLDRMPGWNRTQALKSCKGDTRKLSIEQLLVYQSMPHWKQQRRRELAARS